VKPLDIFSSFINGEESFEELENNLHSNLSTDPDYATTVLTTITDPLFSHHFSESQLEKLNYLVYEYTSEKTRLSDKTRISPSSTSANVSPDQTSALAKGKNKDATVIQAQSHETVHSYNDETSSPGESPATVIQQASTPSGENVTKLQTGSILKERFVLEKILGQGGMGVVYKARDLRKEEAHDRNPYVAIKVLNESFKDHPQSLIALQREARKAQTLAHPNIVTVFDFDRDGETVYMTMEYLEGDSLDRIIKKSHPNPLKKEDAFHIIDGVCNGLAYAHSHNIIHSDLKPGNIFVTDSGAVKIFDFGIARAMKHQDGADKVSGETTLFDAGSLGGLTPAYASFEMLVGGDPDIRDDIYALACIAYELLGGKHPFNKVPANQAKSRNLTPPPLHNIHRRQYKGLLQGLSFDRDTRSATVLQFQRDVVKEKKLGKATYITAFIVVIALAVVITFPVVQYFKQQKNDQLIADLQNKDDKTVEKTLAMLQNIDRNSRDTILNATKDSLIHYFEQKADAEIDSKKNKYNYKRALQILDNAKLYYPDSAQLASIITRVENSKNQLLNDLTKRFNAHLDNGDLLPRSDREDILDILAKVTAIDDKQPLLVDPRLAVAYADQAQRAAQNHNYKQADALLNAGLGLFPSDTTLINIRDAVNEAKTSTASNKEIIAKLKQSIDKSLSIPQKQQRITDLINNPFADRNWENTLLSFMEDIKTQVPENDSWLQNTAASISNLFLKRAITMREKERFTEASKLIKLAKSFSPDMKALDEENRLIANAKKDYETKLAQKAQIAKIEGLKQTLLTQAKANDVKAAKSNLDKLRKVLPPNNPFIKNDAPNAIAEAYSRLAGDLAKRGNYNSAIQLLEAGLKLSPGMAKLRRTLESYKKSLAKSTPSATSSKSSAVAQSSSDPCKSSFAGYGRRSKATCYDLLDSKDKGPAMVVVPAGGQIKKPFAIGKYEVSVSDYNIYCRLSGACKPNTSRAADLPVTGIPVAQAIKYAAWLTKTTGFTYRLPKDSEWLYAANANGAQPGKDFNCRVMLGNTLVKGNALLSINSGKTNGWGLANYIGNAQEWVYTGPNRFSVRGGSFQDSLSNCDTSINRNHSGAADNITGFRLVRDLKIGS